MIDIPNYEGLYKLDLELEKVCNIKKNKYLKNSYSRGLYYVNLYKNGKGKKYTICQLSNMCNLIENNNLVDIPNYDNYKFDTVLNQVYNTETNMYLKNILNINGYYVVSLYKNKINKTFGIHQLVYMCNNPTEDLIDFHIDHIDNDRTNNKIENLRKATRSENCSNAKTYITNKLGIKYIRKNKWNSYEFKLTKNGISYSKTFKTLEETVEYRNRFVLEKCGAFTNLG
tara:strand:- start:44 stop:727 length:684 start_codon:yes stop_codon:yes gene_type:complete